MAEYVIDWMQKHHAIFPNGKTLESWAKGSGQSEEYLNFTDNMFWAALSRILYDDLSDLVPHHIKTFAPICYGIWNLIFSMRSGS